MIGLYKGNSALSRAIQFKTWSPYSHAAWIEEDGSVIEAWQVGGVTKGRYDTRHNNGTIIDIFDVEMTDDQTGTVREFLRSQIGKPYDWPGIFGFVTRRAESVDAAQRKWFCSELVFAACLFAGVELLSRIPACKVYPGLLCYSPLLAMHDQLKVNKPARTLAITGAVSHA